MTGKKNPNKHHHGDLRAALINAGIELIREGGATALSIRKVATRAGVSHAAPAHYFPHLSDLRSAIVAEGYRGFSASMEAEIAKVGDAPDARVLAACHGYIYFAREHSGLFHLMFATPAHEFSGDACQQAADDAYQVLRGVCAPFTHGPDDQQQVELLVWSVVHGFASLFLSKHDRAAPREEAIELFNQIFPNLPLGSTDTMETECPT